MEVAAIDQILYDRGRSKELERGSRTREAAGLDQPFVRRSLTHKECSNTQFRSCSVHDQRSWFSLRAKYYFGAITCDTAVDGDISATFICCVVVFSVSGISPLWKLLGQAHRCAVADFLHSALVLRNFPDTHLCCMVEDPAFWRHGRRAATSHEDRIFLECLKTYDFTGFLAFHFEFHDQYVLLENVLPHIFQRGLR